MRKWGVWLCLMLLLLGSIASVHAQDEECDPAAVATASETAIGLLQTGEYGDLVEARGILAALDSVCLGLDFEGETETVSDPVVIPAGLYRVTVSGDTYFIMDVVPLEGECGARSYGKLFNLMDDQVAAGAAAVLESEGCTAVWEISNIRGPYRVTFEKLK